MAVSLDLISFHKTALSLSLLLGNKVMLQRWIDKLKTPSYYSICQDHMKNWILDRVFQECIPCSKFQKEL